MKKLTLVLLGLIASQWAFSQSESGSNFRFGITAKPAFPTWFKMETNDQDKISTADNDGIKIGFSYGLFSEFAFAENYSVEININHLLYQGSYTLDHTDEHKAALRQAGEKILTSRDWNLQYIEVPISLRMKTNEIGFMTYFGKFGFAPSINVDSRVDNQYANSEKEGDIPADASLFNTSVIIGGGAMYSLGGNTYLNGGITFHNSLIDIQDGDDYSVKPAFISIDLGILF